MVYVQSSFVKWLPNNLVYFVQHHHGECVFLLCCLDSFHIGCFCTSVYLPAYWERANIYTFCRVQLAWDFSLKHGWCPWSMHVCRWRTARCRTIYLLLTNENSLCLVNMNNACWCLDDKSRSLMHAVWRFSDVWMVHHYMNILWFLAHNCPTLTAGQD